MADNTSDSNEQDSGEDSIFNLEETTKVTDDKSVVITSDLLPTVLQVIPLHDRPLFPKMTVPIMVQDSQFMKMLMEAKSSTLFVGFVLAKNQDNADEGPPKAKDMNKVGVAAKILQVSGHHDKEGPLQVIVHVMERFQVVKFMTDTQPWKAKVRYWYEDASSNEIDEELKAYSVSIINSIRELIRLNPLFKEELTLLMGEVNLARPGILADFSASMTTASGEELQGILEERDIHTRVEKVLVLLHKELEISKLQIQINKRIEDRLSTQQREFFLKEQLKEIKKELGLAKEGAETEVEKYLKRMESLTLTEEARERIEEELEKLKVLEPSSAESNVTRAYLDWLTILPWGIYTKDNYDLKKAEKILNQDHYGLKDVKDRILELISVGIIKGDLAGSIVLLVGPPGVGKTSVGQSIARSL
ncbi:MAG: LON peptidase substrate-binding domain-containing protein, partial [SAR324 cluster bacterium]|nr:LON peptidase substrate-binding domain-containing protein [SAR324 cluster bacterium]